MNPLALPNDGSIYFLGDKIPLEVIRTVVVLPHIPVKLSQQVLSYVLKYISGIPSVSKSSSGDSNDNERQQTTEQEMISQLNERMEVEVKKALDNIPERKMRRSELESIEQSMKNGLFSVVFTGFYFILRSAIRQRLKHSDFVDQCTRLMIHEPVLQLLTHLYESKKEELIEVSKNRASWFNTVINVRWRVDVTISTSVMQRVFKPILLLQMELSNGTIRTFEVSLQQFHELRLACATVLNDMNYIANHPIMLIRERD